ncbi:MAG: hypothetical protein CL960_00165 [Euryarchaeota archaeon]|jgi:YegS/Rv2252/BmrU family lipid kinase|nr:hypothetical protein [Euryarchaeota archaeon]MDP6363999.1 diacylglycerol kinase family protein [Candidatus Poseidoniia archaeon]MDP6659180.1 diacylglycerol kinase family protein [Candidatus Poseidoniia archaeon]MDP6846684.1 diacylglycerol kinase family protein [Candidatus Poseidoniia archaeon]MDP7007280.1 diacylglycerol kinase family protein [Candidatus Poseidoniia archaeon]|tara:strand:- start:5367 stop:6272 length:906 start_codon:yes stop_codon:yes gene_type:complete
MAAICFIVNPASGMGQTGRRLEDLRQQAADLDGEWLVTNAPGHATELAAAATGCEIVVAVGGDGTVHEVVNGLMRHPAASRPALAVIPSGTGNDFVFGSRAPPSAERALTALRGSARKRFDLAHLRGAGRDEYICNTAGIGFDATVNMQSRYVLLRDFPKYLIATLWTILYYFAAPRMALRWEGGRAAYRVMMLVVGNGPREGGGFLTTPDSQMDDGILDFLIAGQVDRLQMLGLLPQVLTGTHLASPAVRLVSTTRLALASESDLCIQADGEFYCLPGDGVRRLDVQVVPGALKLVVEQD